MLTILKTYYRLRGHSRFTAELLARTTRYFGFRQARKLAEGVRS